MANAFDRVRYPSLTLALTHPAAIGVFAALYGRPFTPFGASRVLEIGCGEGVNLINMALGAPGAEFVGVDLAEQPIAQASATARRCGCANISFHARDVVELDASFDRFDYILAHGVYSWVPAPARQGLFRVVGGRLSAAGLAIVSYNVNPGSRIRQGIRDMLLYATKGIDEPAAKLDAARTFLIQHSEAWSDGEADENVMKIEARRILDHPPEVLFHDELADMYAPQLLTEVVETAAQFGLGYLCDAQPSLNQEALFPSDVFAGERKRANGDWVRFEQLFDFRTLRRFRIFALLSGRRRDRPAPGGEAAAGLVGERRCEDHAARRGGRRRRPVPGGKHQGRNQRSGARAVPAQARRSSSACGAARPGVRNPFSRRPRSSPVGALRHSDLYGAAAGRFTPRRAAAVEHARPCPGGERRSASRDLAALHDSDRRRAGARAGSADRRHKNAGRPRARRREAAVASPSPRPRRMSTRFWRNSPAPE